ncbi:MAG: outer membrane beta-barrel protein [Elusimicrobia bacterium]|jgi:opacity protein-like surface antigen|nr:outer membrane beta-barrel protein [Elusimicrobiota bacterium]MBK7207331.1 outer membrane beta-barrel protein [Elusimicrobiota bacterium]MBK7546144.1 outer membrane beta-barrel protein [Elusimicrobiota bacterium]MBK7575492.1 outer membrane beta-barrel protein [Elusimicrobiota bacterium]MBK7689202.1 outer membrane beta-barrel protein [Elusimicrobiota bacterium]
MTQTRMILGVLVFLLGVAGARAEGDRPTGNVNLLLTQKMLDEDDWTPLDTQTGFGVMADFKMSSWPIAIAAGYQTTSDNDILFGADMEGSTDELDLGIKYIADKVGNLRPFVGGGLSQIRGKIEGSGPGGSLSVSDTGIGFWLSAGIYWTLAEHINLGGHVKYSSAEVTLADPAIGSFDVDAGGSSLAVFVGYHF